MKEPSLPLPWLLGSVAVRTLIVLAVLVLGLRLSGKRGTGAMNLLDALMVLLLGNAVQNALTYGSGKISIAIVSAAALLLADSAMGITFVRRPWIERKLAGVSRVLVVDGVPDVRAMRHENVSEEEVLAAAREQGVAEMADVHLAVLEPDGDISIIPAEGST